VQENVGIPTHVTRVSQYIKVFVNAPFSYVFTRENHASKEKKALIQELRDP